MTNTVTFSSAVGGDNSVVTDDSDPSTGLGNGGHRARFVPALAQVVAVAGNAVTSATSAANQVTLATAQAVLAAASAATASAAPGTNATSSTNSVAIGTGSKTLTIQTGKSIVVGMFVVAAETATPTNYMFGTVTAYNSGTGSLTINVTQTVGATTPAGWTVALAGAPAPSGTDVQIFTASGANTWSKPSNGKVTTIIMIGSGGGGGSGARTPTNQRRCGGGGGAGGSWAMQTFAASILGATETVTIGAVGTGGAAKSSDGSGNDGTDGAATTFGGWFAALGGGKGKGGVGNGAESGDGGAPGGGLPGGTSDNTSGGAGGNGYSSSAPNAPFAWGIGAAGGGGGAGEEASVTTGHDGVAGGSCPVMTLASTYAFSGRNTAVAGGTAGTFATPTAAGAGVAVTTNLPMGGSGGGGGYYKTAVAAGAGGNGGKYGGGGGGGGAADTGNNSGNGGDGALGIAIVITTN